MLKTIRSDWCRRIRKDAPLYDLMCAAVYRQVDQSLPQVIAGRFNAPDLRRADWQALAEEIGLSGASTVRRVMDLAAHVSATCDDVAPHGEALAGDPARRLQKIIHSIRKRCRRILVQSRG